MKRTAARKLRHAKSVRREGATGGLPARADAPAPENAGTGSKLPVAPDPTTNRLRDLTDEVLRQEAELRQG
ncbi:MAG: hypothetical protein KY433_01470, partial [Actinobacteria bacterium]|nr:hypothetical protein [Actinomycetota bacterium]